MVISYPRLRELLEYDAGEGVFRWAVSRGFKKRGTKASTGRITIDGRVYQAGKLAWFYTHCRWPSRAFRYVNGDSRDIRLENLTERPAGSEGRLRVVDYWVKMTRVQAGYKLVMTRKHEADADLGTYSDYATASEIQRMALECSN